MNKTISYPQRFLATGIVVWAIISFVYSIILTGVLKTYNITTTELVMDAIINNLLLTGCCLLIVNNMRYYLPRQEKYWYVLMISLGLSGLSVLISRLILWLIFRNDLHYIQSLSASAGLRFGILFLLISCMSLVSLLWYTQEEQKKMNERKADSERLAREAELFKLRQQLQPHFLFNSLNSISALTGTQPEKARHMIQQLSDFLRGTLKKDDQQWNTLEEELQSLRLYLDIEKVRFGHRLQTEIVCPEEVLALKLPSLLLQPLVENAIKFGLYDTTEDVLIKMEAIEDKNYLKITIQNPFDPETSQPLKGTGFGLSSVQRRLFLLFARQDLLKTGREEKIFITTILIPQL
ncbi:MAG TPA: histidine kinase [Chitinophagaceae bacterium]|nr:histidine kinase [Chitinophagaceae bacterium]